MKVFSRTTLSALFVMHFSNAALAAEASRTVSLPRLHEGGLMGLGAVIAVAGIFSLLRRSR